ncbi:14532_t:CDS:2 [Ambispora leptoticha]|uniref:14532_t:CDS:1 n=1 Tax=Ambispora leptoticha TaxID=144679 RepID=A0A9N8VIZ3_9GLOM|nr:14532_t:CDS:2 [Ambispora leptoticha]
MYDKPYLQITVEPVTTLPAPYIYFEAPFNFTLTCDLLDIGGNIINAEKQKLRSNFIEYSSKKISNRLMSYVGLVWGGVSSKNESLLNFSQQGVYGLSVQFFSNQTFDESIDNLPANFNGIKAYLYDAMKEKIDFSMAKQISANARNEQIDNANSYVLSPMERTIVRFNRMQNNDLDGHKYRNHLGIGAKPNSYYLISSRAEIVSPFIISNFKPLSTFELYYDSRLVTINEQIRDKTVLSILSSLGGAFGLWMGIFVFCFGAPQIAPWGWAQELYGVRHALKVQLRSKFSGHVPLVDSAPSKNYNEKSDYDRVDALEIRCAALELLLKDYVIDVGDLEDLTKSRKIHK